MKIFLLLFAMTVILFSDYIKEYNITIDLKQSGEFIVTEDILYKFNTNNMHGIYRFIPNKVEVNETYINIKMQDFQVLHNDKPTKFIKSEKDFFTYIKIGSKDKKVYGEHKYTISYIVRNCILPSIKTKNKDMLFWNAIGNQWEVDISKVKVDLYLPKELSKKHIKVVYPKDPKKYKWIDNNHISFYTYNLPKKFGFGIILEFESNILAQNGHQKYIVAQNIKEKNKIIAQKLKNEHMQKIKQNAKIARNFSYAELIAFLFALFMLKKYKIFNFKSAKTLVTQYYPPKSLSILQAGLLLDKYADKKDLAAAVLELATLKELKIVKSTKHNKIVNLKKQNSTLTNDQKLLHKALFELGDTFELNKEYNSKSVVVLDALDTINDNLYKWSVDSGFSVDNFKNIRSKYLFKTIIAVLLIFATAFALIFFQYRQEGNSSVVLFLTATALIIPFVLAFFHKISLKLKLITLIVFTLILSFIAKSAFIFNIDGLGLSFLDFILNPLIFGVFINIILIDNFMHLGKLTQKGIETIEHLKGLKEFIQKVSVQQIEHLLQEDKYYLDKMLPYAMLFNQIKHWLKFYDIINIAKPQISNGSLNALQSFESDFLASTTPPSSSGSSSSGGGIGGGGFSGGGGGGGGGSW
jgi:uncharacterized membrane protein YgcG